MSRSQAEVADFIRFGPAGGGAALDGEGKIELSA
jgi:hypothetical protein